MTRSIRILLLAAVAFLFAGCASVERVPGTAEPAETTPERAAYDALARGDFQQAAQFFSRLAATAEAPERQEYQLKAAEALLRAGLLSQAGQILDGLSGLELTPRQVMKVQLLRAENALRQHEPDRALSLLAEPAADEAEGDLHADYHALRARAFARLGNHLETAREYVERESFLTNPVQVQANQTSIWEALSMLPESTLSQLRTLPPPDPFAGWVELVRIATDIRLATEQVANRLADWQQRYPAHPAVETFAVNLLERSRKLVLQPKRIALLLPMTGRFAGAGAAVRDGILGAYYSDAAKKPDEIRVYDTGANPNHVLSVYQQALNDGSDFVIGPLRKEAVNTLAQRADFPVPTVALNFADIYFTAHDNLFQFALSPEDEARQVAERTWLDGHGRAALLVPEGEWGERVRRAYQERWDELGGDVVTVRTFDASESDFSRPLQGMLNLDDSYRRFRALTESIGRKPEFSPRRRQDIDFIFMAAFPREGRLIRPQLRFHHAAHIPVYATSHVYSAKHEPEQDRDMDGVVFGDMPWTLGTETPYEDLRAGIITQLRNYGPGVYRLLALGVDAYHLIPKVRLLDEYPYERFQGETGSLHVDESNLIRRQLTWARFEGGRPQVLNDAQAVELQ